MLCLRKNGNYPGTSLRELGPTLREDLGGDGKVLLYYNTDESKLVLMLTFCYGQGSAEMELIAECIDDMNIGEEDPLPGDISHVHTVYIEGRELSEVNFISENVKKKDLRMAADRLLDRVFDWLDILYEAFEDEF